MCYLDAPGHGCVEEGVQTLRQAVALYTSHFSGLHPSTLSTIDLVIAALIKQVHDITMFIIYHNMKHERVYVRGTVKEYRQGTGKLIILISLDFINPPSCISVTKPQERKGRCNSNPLTSHRGAIS